MAEVPPLRLGVAWVDRDLSWLEFNRRVLNEALDERTPLLERVRFLGIFTSNLDEFFMKRVGALKRQMLTGALSRTPDGRTAAEILLALRQALLPMLQNQADCYAKVLKPALTEK